MFVGSIMVIVKPNIKIITNNPLVRPKYPDFTEFHEKSAEYVLLVVRDKVHLSAIILNHPLSGGLLPGANPYKSIVIADSAGDAASNIDFESISLIERAIELLIKPPEGFKGFENGALEDFQVLDLDLLDSAMITINT